MPRRGIRRPSAVRHWRGTPADLLLWVGGVVPGLPRLAQRSPPAAQPDGLPTGSPALAAATAGPGGAGGDGDGAADGRCPDSATALRPEVGALHGTHAAFATSFRFIL